MSSDREMENVGEIVTLSTVRGTEHFPCSLKWDNWTSRQLQKIMCSVCRDFYCLFKQTPRNSV